MPKENPRVTEMESKKRPVKHRKQRKPVGLEIIRTAGGDRGKTERGRKKIIKRKYIKGNEKPIEDARIFDSEG